MTLKRRLLLLYLRYKNYVQILFGYLFVFFVDYFFIFGIASLLLRINYLIPSNDNDYLLSFLIFLGCFAINMRKIIPEPIKHKRSPFGFKLLIGHTDITKK